MSEVAERTFMEEGDLEQTREYLKSAWTYCSVVYDLYPQGREKIEQINAHIGTAAEAIKAMEEKTEAAYESGADTVVMDEIMSIGVIVYQELRPMVMEDCEK